MRSPAAVRQSQRRERRTLLCIAMMAAVLIVGFASVGYRSHTDGMDVVSPLLGGSSPSEGGLHAPPGWYCESGRSLSPALWVVLPPLAGWAFLRSIWIPTVVAGQATRDAVLSLARHLSGVYLYVYLMILAGAGVLALLIRVAPLRTETFRFLLAWFLFGESFFVPAVMWLRLIVNDRSGEVFGKLRYVALACYVLLCVILPIVGMMVDGFGVHARPCAYFETLKDRFSMIAG